KGTIRLTVAQATIRYLQNQFVERDGVVQPFFAGCFGIFGHGNVGGIGQALLENKAFKYYPFRNEQAMVHTAIAYAKVKNRMSAFVCTTSIGPGATNMVTGAATATINRLPVLLLPGDIFANRSVDPVLQQLESQHSNDVSVNDCFRPVSKYWDRIQRPEQLIAALPKAMQILTSPAETGAVTIAIPQDVQAEAYDFPAEFFKKKVWTIQRQRPDRRVIKQAAALIVSAKKPVIIAGGGVIYSDACTDLKRFIDKTGIPVAETFAGKGALRYDEPLNLGAVGVTGTPGAISMCQQADLVIGIGTRYSDFTTMSQSAFQNPKVRFVNINVSEFDGYKQGALPVIADAKEALNELMKLVGDHHVPQVWEKLARRYNKEWDKHVHDVYAYRHKKLVSQGEVIGAVNTFAGERDIVLCAAGSLPGDLHKLWRTTDSKGFHLEYGYSCMGYEIAGGLGAKLADPSREVFVMVGDGSYLMMSQEIVTSIQEGIKFIVVLLNNHGYASIGGLSQSLGSQGFGTHYRFRNERSGQLDGNNLPVDLATNAESLGAHVLRTKTIEEFNDALVQAKLADRTTVIYIETDRE
ncbi:MAG TPA: 3D-(3,5/4)-trihydroxycyclohexane-1,2-dione acylhydrolase (decyclizing), partial [Phnomibacter sp.]|nr:3D-(3,5/4)-trihydroxycyclohexane-1,2-dione acylhydrolase (decyclizing) [Phnomibacter sp.]